MDLSKQVYLAHEAKYNATGIYIAFSEGNTPTGFIYEWVVLPNGDTWKIMNAGETSFLNIIILFTLKFHEFFGSLQHIICPKHDHLS